MPEVENQSSRIWNDETIGSLIDSVKREVQIWSWKIWHLLILVMFNIHYFSKKLNSKIIAQDRGDMSI